MKYTKAYIFFNLRARAVRGFTLVELMVTIAILGILITLALPSFASLIERMRIEGAVGKLRTDIAYARTEAMRTGQSVHICKRDGASTTACGTGTTANWEQGWLVFSDLAPANNKIDDTETAMRISDGIMGTGVDASANTKNYLQDGFTFNADGTPLGVGAGCIKFCRTGGCAQINPNGRYLVLNRIGRMRVLTEDEMWLPANIKLCQ